MVEAEGVPREEHVWAFGGGMIERAGLGGGDRVDGRT